MKKRAISIICAWAMLVCCACGCGSTKADISDRKTNTTQKTNIYSVSGKNIYNSGSVLYSIGDNDTFSLIDCYKFENSGKEDVHLPVSARASLGSVVEGTNIYSSFLDAGEIRRWNISDLNDPKYDVLYQYDDDKVVSVIKEKYQNSDLLSEYNNDPTLITGSVLTVNQDLADGGDGNIYYPYVPDVESYTVSTPIAFDVFYFAKDGSKFGVLDDVRASALTSDGGYIYYYDAGYMYAPEEGERIDASKTGIYKMRTDGSDKQLLVSLKQNAEKNEDPKTAMKSAGMLNVINDKLYYIGTDSYLYQVGLNGGDPVKVTSGMCNNYYIDSASGMLYYVKGEFRYETASGYPLVCVPLDGGEEKELSAGFMNYHSYSGTMTVFGDCLYFANPDFYLTYWLDIPNIDSTPLTDLCGLRIDLRTGKCEKLVVRVRAELGEVDPSGNYPIRSAKEPVIKWEAYEQKNYLR